MAYLNTVNFGGTMVELIEIAPGRWRVKRPALQPPRSDLSAPMLISDIMPPTEQVDGNFYESKSAFRAVGRSLGLIEVGNEKIPPKPKGLGSSTPAAKAARREALKKAMDKVRT
jgi:hypothetical protein